LVADQPKPFIVYRQLTIMSRKKMTPMAVVHKSNLIKP